MLVKNDGMCFCLFNVQLATWVLLDAYCCCICWHLFFLELLPIMQPMLLLRGWWGPVETKRTPTTIIQHRLVLFFCSSFHFILLLTIHLDNYLWWPMAAIVLKCPAPGPFFGWTKDRSGPRNSQNQKTADQDCKNRSKPVCGGPGLNVLKAV